VKKESKNIMRVWKRELSKIGCTNIISQNQNRNYDYNFFLKNKITILIYILSSIWWFINWKSVRGYSLEPLNFIWFTRLSVSPHLRKQVPRSVCFSNQIHPKICCPIPSFIFSKLSHKPLQDSLPLFIT
jgi:hypothetical protein